MFAFVAHIRPEKFLLIDVGMLRSSLANFALKHKTLMLSVLLALEVMSPRLKESRSSTESMPCGPTKFI